jgi:hypothetical protein
MASTNLVFLPWLRRGLATAIARPDTGPGSTAVPVTTFGVAITATANDPTTVANVNLPLVGPGDIAGLDPRVVVRTEPGKDESDAEFKHFVAIEFDQADLPWRYTPAAANSAGQLHPWFTLAVLKDNEWSPETPSPTQKLPVAIVNSGTFLPPLDTAWANAHVQLHGAAINATTTDALNQVLQGQPGQFVARLLCPRVLAQKTSYTAMLVPTYMRGVIAGLGTRPDNTVDALTPAWKVTDTSIRLPVYYQWKFQTGVVGDFQDLAAALTPEPVPASVGRRDIDVSVPGFDLPNAAVTPSAPSSPPTPTVTAMPMEGALQSFQASNLAEPPVSTNWLTAIENFVNQQTTSVNQQTRPLVTPPLYGRWHAARTQLNSATNQPWLFELNSDPRNRVSGGLGTLVVEERHQELMASAWSQIEGLLQSNSERKFLQLGREAFTRAFSRHVQSGTTDSIHLVFGILQRWVLRLAGDITIHSDFGQSFVGRDIFDPQWRRLTRPRGPIGRRQLRHIPGQVPPFNPVTRLSTGNSQPAPPPPDTPGGMVSPSVIFTGSVPGGLTPPEVTILVTQGNDVMLFWGILLFCVSRKLLAAGAGRAWWWLLRVLRFGLELIRLAAGTTSTTIRIAVRDGTLTPTQVSGAGTTSVFKLQPTFPTTIPPPAAPGGNDSTDAGQFRGAYGTAIGATASPGLPAIIPTAIDVAATLTRLLGGLSPSVTLISSIAARFRVFVNWQQPDSLEPVQVAPSFSQPMWAPLRDESVDWILPGLELVPTNSVGLVVSNQRFIEAYMVGLNHEMARTLLWNDFPTDQRGTYFQQFWDSRGNTTGSSLDINPITSWNAAKGLGNNSARSTPPSLVLLVRGDIIRRYPNTVVYAIATPATEPPPSTAAQVLPIFSGQLTRDVAYYGFPLSKNDVLTGNGYVFILQEQPAEPRFADPDPTKQGNPASEPTFILPNDSAVNATTAAAFASATFQHPVRVIIPGNLLVPPN